MIYIHVPFCHRKCTYCAFYSKPVTHTSEGRRSVISDYVDALINEMRQRRDEQAHPIKTVYFGGGTPSILPLSELERIVMALRGNFDLSQVEEVTLEANPEDLTEEYLLGLKAMNFVNRLSIGIQSMDDEVLRLIGRRHTAAQAVAAVENAYKAGFHNLSVDLIYGLPEVGGRKSEVGGDFSYLLPHTSDLITHVSAYALTVEPGTALAVQVEQGRVVLPDEDEVVRQYEWMCKHLEENGFKQYEVSNFARPGFHSRHNSRYWDRTPYLGLGPGAHSFTLSDGGSTSVAHGGKRRWNKPDGTFEEETLSDADAFNELVMTSLRTTRGLDVNRVPEEYKKKLHQKMQLYLICGWVSLIDSFYQPTREGLLHADGMAASLFLS